MAKRYEFQFVGPGLHREHGKNLKPGEKFETGVDFRNRSPSIAQRFRFLNEWDDDEQRTQRRRRRANVEASPAEEGKGEEGEPVNENAESEPERWVKLEPVERGGGWWNVQNTETGEVINDKSLRYDEAVEMCEQYNG